MPVRPLIRPGGFFATLAVAVVVGLVRALPAGLRRSLARGLGALAFALGIRRAVALDNLAHAYPELTEAERRGIASRCYRNLAAAAVDSLCVDLISDADLERTVVVDDWDMVARAVAAGGVLVASAHFGSWELLAEVLARRSIKLTAVVRPLEGAFNARIVKGRRDAGVELILQRGALGNMIKAVRRGRTVVQLIDQSLPADAGVFVPFFGRPASTTPALSMAALRTKAPVFVALAAWEGDRLHLSLDGPIPLPDTGDRRADVTAHTAMLTAVIERRVREHPDQWLWLHRRWKVKPP